MKFQDMSSMDICPARIPSESMQILTGMEKLSETQRGGTGQSLRARLREKYRGKT